jgi:aspartate/methionine/tyrosine aminotransferase
VDQHLGRASARSDVPPFYVMEMLAAAQDRVAAGRPAYNLAAGQPSTSAPAGVRAAAVAALNADRIGYTSATGLLSLRMAIAGHTRDWYGVEVDPAEVVVTTGSSGGFLLAFLACFDAGDAVAMARPGYPAYRNILASLGCEVLEFECGPEQGYLPSVAALEALPKLPAGLILASPANPTGAMISSRLLAELAGWCGANGVRLISDEIYHGISYTEPASCAWEFDRTGVVVNSFSKYFSMTGWRLGWLLVPEDLRVAVDGLAGNYAICPPALSQWAAVSAFDCYPELEANVARYASNRVLLLDRLRGIGVDRLAPADGAFYVYADVSEFTEDSLPWVRAVLAETGVAIAPGLDFDPVAGHQFARFSFAGDAEEITQGIDVLGRYLLARG